MYTYLFTYISFMKKRITLLALLFLVAFVAFAAEGQADATSGGVMDSLTRFCLQSLDHWWVIVLFMAIESSFIPFPSEVVVPPAAWLALQDGSSLSIVGVVLLATLGANIGALVNYYLALGLGRTVVYKFADSRLGHLCLLNGEKVAHAEEYFRAHGVPSTFFGRLVPAVRQLISIPAGLARMDLKKFLIYTTLGAGLWNCVLAALGYVVKVSFPDVKTVEDVVTLATKYSHEIGMGILVILALVIVFFVVKKIIKHRRQSADKNAD